MAAVQTLQSQPAAGTAATGGKVCARRVGHAVSTGRGHRSLGVAASSLALCRRLVLRPPELMNREQADGRSHAEYMSGSAGSLHYEKLSRNPRGSAAR